MKIRVVAVVWWGWLLAAALAWAGNTHAPTGDVAREQRAWWGDALTTGYVVSTPPGMCVHGTSASTTASVSLCRAYAINSGPPRQLEYIEDLASRNVNYTAGAGLYWLVVHASINEFVTGWTRVLGTHYLWRQSATQPSLPDRATWLLSATITGTAITAVTDLRLVGSPLAGTFLGLSDTPASYAGQALKGLRVNSGETGLEFTDTGPGAGDSVQVNGSAVNTTGNLVGTGDVLFTLTPGSPDAISAALKPDIVGPNQLADVDFGDFTCADGAAGCVLDTGSVTSAKILDGTLASGDFTAGAVNTAALGANSVTAAKMADADHGDVSWLANVARVENVQCSNCISDVEVEDTITASNYLPLAGGTLTGLLRTDNLGIEFDESDVNPPCAVGNYNIFADLSEATLKKCLNGVISVLDTGGTGGGGDQITVNSVAVDTTANFSDQGDIAYVRTAGPTGGPDTITGQVKNSTVTAAKMADADHGAVAWTAGVATVQSVQSGTTLPASPAAGDMTWITDDSVSGAGDSSGGTGQSWCRWTGSVWTCIGSDYLRNVKSDCSGDIAAGLWCKDAATGAIYQGNGSAAVQINIGAVAPGSNSQITYNNAGSFAGDAGLTWNQSTDALTVAGSIQVTCDTALEDCINTWPNETAPITEPTTPNSCNWGFVSDQLQSQCTGGTFRTYTTADSSGNVTVTGELRGKRTPRVGLADVYTMLTTDCGTTIANDDADGLEVDLIADPTGCVVCFFGETNQAIILDPNGSDIFVVNGLAPAAGDSLTLAAGVGNNVCLQGKNATTWYVWLGTGSVTDTN